MNQTLQLTDYIPQYISLYYVDYRDDLDEHEDIQEECIRSNNMEKLYEKAYEWYEEQESSNMHDYLEETRKNMEADNLAGEFEEHEDEIRELIYDRNDSDPIKDLIRNSSVTNFFYSLGVEISGYLTGCSLRGESVAMACHKVRRALHLKKGQFDEKIEELVENATYGGELNHRLTQYKRRTKELLCSEKGLKHRGQRCIEPEAVFGQIKNNMNYKRFRHFGKDKVFMDFAFLAIAFNIKKMCAKLTKKGMNWLIRLFYELTTAVFRCWEHINQRNLQKIAA